MSATPVGNSMSRGFAGMTAPQYDAWRRAAEFHEIETAIVAPQVRQRRFVERVLDLGCGTGTWTRIAAALFPAAEITGIDIDAEMIEFAATTVQEERISYTIGDCCNLGPLEAADIILCGMSADYIGFDCVSRAVGENLRRGGAALVWVLDPTAYEVRDGHRVKRWRIGGDVIYATAPLFAPDEVCATFRERRLDVDLRTFPFTLTDARPRTLLVYYLTRKD